MENKDYHFINSFWLKIIGMITMVIDHFAAIAISATGYSFMSVQSYHIMRIIGRIAFILFAFQTVESVLKSKKPLLYLIRLFSLALVCDIGMFIFLKEYVGNPVGALFLGATFVYLLNHKKWYIKPLCLLPLGFTILTTLDIIPIKIEYGLYGVITIIVFYISYLLSKYFSKYVISTMGLEEETFMHSSYYLALRNSISCLLFLTFSIIVYFVNPVWNGTPIFSSKMTTQVYAVLAIIPIFFYNEKRGYNAKWFSYFCYAFFPLHIVLIYIILLITL